MVCRSEPPRDMMIRNCSGKWAPVPFFPEMGRLVCFERLINIRHSPKTHSFFVEKEQK